MAKKLLLLLVCITTTVCSFAQSGTYGENIKWILENDGTLTISGTGEMQGDFWIDAPWLEYNFKITNVVIEEGVTTIGERAFTLCSNLITIIIPASVIDIVPITPFKGCDNLSDFKVAENNKYYSSLNGVLFNKNQTTLIQYPVGKINNEYEIPESVINIDDYAFALCNNLTSVSIPDNLINIGMGVFTGCSNLTLVTIGSGVETIGEETFMNCNNLVAIEVDEDNEYFSTTNGVLFDKNQTTLIKYPAGKTDNQYDIPDGVVNIEAYAFVNGNKLISASIPESVTTIGPYAFFNCSNLVFIDTSNDVESIGCWAFDNTPWYNSLPDGIIYIAKVLYAYKGQMPVNTSIDIQDGILSITGYAFYFCGNMISITLPESLTSIGANAFESCSGLTSIEIPKSVTFIGSNAFRYSPVYKSFPLSDGIIYINDILYACETTHANVEVRAGTVSIADAAFMNRNGLISVTIPNGVVKIGAWAFANCSNLTSISIPESVTDIGKYAFIGCTNLTTFTIPDNVTNIESEAFANCSNLTSITTLNLVPVGVYSSVFGGINKRTCVLKVPSESVELYQEALGWQNFRKIVAIGEDVNTIKTPKADVVISVLPNPTKESLCIGGIKELTIVSILDISGKIVLQQKVSPNENVSVGHLTSGVYFVNVKNEIVKIIKQ